MRVAAVDLGSDSTRLLVADVEDGRAREIDWCAEVTRLGSGVDRDGVLSERAMEATLATVRRLARRIEAAGCERVGAVLTSAVRDARNGDAFADELRRAYPWEVCVLDGSTEAWLAFRGATSSEPLAAPTLVIDVGGGSTELAVGTADGLLLACSANVGTLRLAERHLRGRAPRDDAMTAVRRDVARELERHVPPDVATGVSAGCVAATTPTWRLARALFHAGGSHVARPECAALGERLWGGQPRPTGVAAMARDRPAVIAVGLAILIEVMDAFALDAVRLVERDLLHGLAMALAAAREGRPPGWARLQEYSRSNEE